jgi:hypothetical protein
MTDRRAAAAMRVLAMGSLVLGCVACGSEDDEPGEKIEGPPHYPGAQPCNIDSGYAGDEYCIAPPEEGKGFQLHYGPKTYDQAEIDKFLIQPGEEFTDCVFVKTPNDTEVFINQYHARMRPGSHHMITFTKQSDVPDSDGPEECNQGADSRFLVGAQEPVIDILADQSAPEEAGYAMRLEANQQAAIQLHYVNTGTEPILREAWVNVLFADPSKVTTLVDPLFWIGGYLMNIPPHSKHTITAACTAPETATEGMHVLQVTGHYHAHTVRFSAWFKPAGSEERTLIYESYDFNDPGFAYFNSVDDNPEPKPETKNFGSMHDGPLYMKPGDTIEWECEVDNTSENTLVFDNGAYTAEMCNLFGTYAPSMGEPWSCFNL